MSPIRKKALPDTHSRTLSPIQAFHNKLFDVIPFPIYVVDISTLRIVNVNKSMCDKTGATVGDVCHWAIYRQAEPCSFCKIAELQKIADREPADLIFEHFNDWDECWYQVHEALMTWWDGGSVKHSTAVNIADLKVTQNELSEAYALLALKSLELERLSATDALTNLFNRRHLDEIFAHEFNRARRYGQPLSVILADIDSFKAINDAQGHHVGDQVLQKVAVILQQAIRSVDTIGRWGGEEFLIISPNTELDGARALAEKLRHAVEESSAIPTGHLTSSFGVAQCRDGEEMADLLARADKALYRAKDAGRNRVEG